MAPPKCPDQRQQSTFVSVLREMVSISSTLGIRRPPLQLLFPEVFFTQPDKPNATVASLYQAAPSITTCPRQHSDHHQDLRRRMASISGTLQRGVARHPSVADRRTAPKASFSRRSSTKSWSVTSTNNNARISGLATVTESVKACSYANQEATTSHPRRHFSTHPLPKHVLNSTYR